MTLKASVKSLIGTICESPLLRSHVRKSALRSVNVVYYHYVGRPAPHYDAFYCGCTISKFEDDLRRLREVFDFASLDEVLSGAGKDRPLLAVTFDDGFNLLNDQILDILDRYRISATSFVITSCIGNARLMWRHALSAIRTLAAEDVWRTAYDSIAAAVNIPCLRRGEDLMVATSNWDMRHKDEWAALLWTRCQLPSMVDYLAEKQPYFHWDGLRQWVGAGHGVGFHTHTHPYCSRLEAIDLEGELIRPAQDLKQRLGISDLCLSYPFGERLVPPLESKLFATGLFKAFFGIQGFQKRQSSRARLERAAIEGSPVAWPVFAALALPMRCRAA